MTSESKCPVAGGENEKSGSSRAHGNRHWWPDQLNIQVLHGNSSLSDPMAEDFDYAKEFNSLDLNAVISDLHALDRKSTRLNSSHQHRSRMPSSA